MRLKKTLLFFAQTILLSALTYGQENSLTSADSITYVGNPQSQIEHYFSVSNSFSDNREYDSALFYLSEAEKLARLIKDYPFLAEVKFKQGRLFDIQSMYQKSEGCYIEAIHLYGMQSDTLNSAKSYNRLGIAYKHLGFYSKAISVLNKGLKLYVGANDSLGQANVRINIGNVFKNVGKTNKAKQEYREALSIYIDFDDESSMANCYNNLGNVYKNDGMVDSAFYYMYKTVAIRKKRENQKGLSYIYHNLANLHLQVDQLDSSLFYADLSYSIKLQEADIYGQAGDLQIYAEVYMKKELWDKSIRYLETALFLSKGYENLDFELAIQQDLALCYKEVGNYKASCEWFIECLETKSAIEQNNSTIFLENALIEYELLSDSIRKEQLILQQDLQKAKNKNDELLNKVLRRNLYILIISIILILFFLIPVLLRYRQRLRASRKSHQILEKSSVPKEEKEILLKEVHHRVKNNFQIINSLIRIQSEFITKDNYQEKLTDLQTRIRSMALIHEKLYKNDNLSKLNVREYLKQLSINIFESYEVSTKLEFKMDVEEVEYSIDSLIPLGLILNETISNSIKHGFKGMKKGEIFVQLKNTDTSTVLIIKDNGIGSSNDIEDLKKESLGLELITDLSEQLDGKLELDLTNGFSYSFNFPRLK